MYWFLKLTAYSHLCTGHHSLTFTLYVVASCCGYYISETKLYPIYMSVNFKLEFHDNWYCPKLCFNSPADTSPVPVFYARCLLKITGISFWVEILVYPHPKISSPANVNKNNWHVGENIIKIRHGSSWGSGGGGGKGGNLNKKQLWPKIPKHHYTKISLIRAKMHPEQGF